MQRLPLKPNNATSGNDLQREGLYFRRSLVVSGLAPAPENPIHLRHHPEGHPLLALVTCEGGDLQLSRNEEFGALLDGTYTLCQLAEAANGEVDGLSVAVAHCQAEIAVALAALLACLTSAS